MSQLYSYKYRLKPTKEQEILLSKHFGCVRWIYNEFLAQRINEYKTNNKTSNENQNNAQIPKLKLVKPWLKEVNAQSLQYSVECLQDAYLGFFGSSTKGKKLKTKRGFPKFKKRSDKQSFRVKQRIKIIDDKLIIPKFLEGIKFVKHRELEGGIRFATISKNKAGQYHASITVFREIQPLPINDNKIGIDLNVANNVDSNGKSVANPRPGNQYKSRLRLLNKSVSRKAKGSKNRTKSKIKLAKLYLKVHNKREDHLHKYSRQIINENQVIVCENLCVESMLAKVSPDKREETRQKEKNRHFDIQDCGWSSLINKLKYKSKFYGREFIQVSRWFPSSQICNHCGERFHELPKGCKEWCCHKCWEYNLRDFNSAKNILEERLRIKTSGTEGLAYCPDVRPDGRQLVG